MPKKNRKRKLYDIPPELAQRIKELSEEFGIPESQLISYYSATGLLDSEDKFSFLSRLRKSKSIRWKYNIDMDDLIDRLKNFDD